jgi:hypothetical protein
VDKAERVLGWKFEHSNKLAILAAAESFINYSSTR